MKSWRVRGLEEVKKVKTYEKVEKFKGERPQVGEKRMKSSKAGE